MYMYTYIYIIITCTCMYCVTNTCMYCGPQHYNYLPDSDSPLLEELLLLELKGLMFMLTGQDDVCEEQVIELGGGGREGEVGWRGGVCRREVDEGGSTGGKLSRLGVGESGCNDGGGGDVLETCSITPVGSAGYRKERSRVNKMDIYLQSQPTSSIFSWIFHCTCVFFARLLLLSCRYCKIIIHVYISMMTMYTPARRLLGIESSNWCNSLRG